MDYHRPVTLRAGEIIDLGPENDSFSRINREPRNYPSQPVEKIKLGTCGKKELDTTTVVEVDVADHPADFFFERNAPLVLPIFILKAD